MKITICECGLSKGDHEGLNPLAFREPNICPGYRPARYRKGMTDIEQLLRNCPEALKEFRELEGVSDYYFDLAFGVTPSLFVTHKNDIGESVTTRIRLFDNEQVNKWLGRAAEVNNK